MEHITSQQPDKKFHQTYIHKVVAFLVNICVVRTYIVMCMALVTMVTNTQYNHFACP